MPYAQKIYLVFEVFDYQGQVDVVCTFFQKSFDQIGHYVLLAKLKWFDFSPLLVRLCKSYG